MHTSPTLSLFSASFNETQTRLCPSYQCYYTLSSYILRGHEFSRFRDPWPCRPLDCMMSMLAPLRSRGWTTWPESMDDISGICTLGGRFILLARQAGWGRAFVPSHLAGMDARRYWEPLLLLLSTR